MQTVTLINEKGNASNTVRAALKEAFVANLKETLGTAVVDTPRGLAIEVAIDFRTQTKIYALIEPVITTDVEPRAPKASKAKDPVVVPELNLFQSAE